MSNNNNNPQRTSPRFSKSTSSPQHYESQYSDNSSINSAANSSIKYATNINNVSPTRVKKRNTSSRIFSPMEEEVATINSSMELDTMQIYLHKINLLYQSLEVRVQKLENIVADQFFTINSNAPYPIIPRNPQIDNSGADFNMSSFSISSNSTSTTASSANTLMGPNLHSSGGTSTISSLIDPIQREISVLYLKMIPFNHYLLVRNRTWMIIVCLYCRRELHLQLES